MLRSHMKAFLSEQTNREGVFRHLHYTEAMQLQEMFNIRQDPGLASPPLDLRDYVVCLPQICENPHPLAGFGPPAPWTPAPLPYVQ